MQVALVTFLKMGFAEGLKFPECVAILLKYQKCRETITAGTR